MNTVIDLVRPRFRPIHKVERISTSRAAKFAMSNVANFEAQEMETSSKRSTAYIGDPPPRWNTGSSPTRCERTREEFQTARRRRWQRHKPSENIATRWGRRQATDRSVWRTEVKAITVLNSLTHRGRLQSSLISATSDSRARYFDPSACTALLEAFAHKRRQSGYERPRRSGQVAEVHYPSTRL